MKNKLIIEFNYINKDNIEIIYEDGTKEIVSRDKFSSISKTLKMAFIRPKG